MIYRDKDFIDDDYTKGYKRPWATERFTGTKHWYNPETGGTYKSPGCTRGVILITSLRRMSAF